MKVLIILMILGVAAVFAMPLEEKSENEKAEVLTNVEAEPIDFDIGLVNDELVRDKRNPRGRLNSVLSWMFILKIM